MNSVAATFLSVFCLAGCATTHSTPSPYSGQQSRDIKALSEDEIQGYLAGKGMGFARPAELNGYPGPAHVLALGDRIGLTVEQRRRSQEIFDTMQSSAMALGRQLVEEERALDRLFATRSASSANVAAALERIASLQARIRAAHLDAHLAQAAVLTAAQVADYVVLRGYDDHHH